MAKSSKQNDVSGLIKIGTREYFTASVSPSGDDFRNNNFLVSCSSIAEVEQEIESARNHLGSSDCHIDLKQFRKMTRRVEVCCLHRAAMLEAKAVRWEDIRAHDYNWPFPIQMKSGKWKW